MINPSIVGDAHLQGKAEGGHPFAIGILNPKRGFVHVLDEVTLDAVLRTLDTAADLTRYLARKERLLLAGRLGAFGEEDLLAYYLSNIDRNGEHMFPLPAGNAGLLLAEGQWRRLWELPQVRRKLEADRVSYIWDHIIDAVGGHAIAGTLVAHSHSDLAAHEKGLRILASESRLRRRMLARMFREIVLSAGEDRVRIRTSFPSKPGDPHYVFLAAGAQTQVVGEALNHDEYRDWRRKMLATYCAGALARYGPDHGIVGIATEGASAEGSSFDLVFVEKELYTNEELEEARRVCEGIGWFKNTRFSQGEEFEFPEPSRPARLESKIGRNDACPCGSGKKYKRCHGR